MRPRKRFGQHWLRSDEILSQIIAAAELQPTDRVLEIGPGQGALTRRILPWVQGLVSVELDWDLHTQLEQEFGDRENFRLLRGDFLATSLEPLCQDSDRFWPLSKVVANIPYNITGPILERLIGRISRPNPQPYERIVLLVQKEVAERVCAAPGSKVFGALSVRCQYHADCEIICDVPPAAFKPPPKVESAVLRIWPRPPVDAARDPRLLETLVKVGFATKRKMLRNNLKGLVPPERLEIAFAAVGIDPEARAETVMLPKWVALANVLADAD